MAGEEVMMGNLVEGFFAGGRLYYRHWDTVSPAQAEIVVSHGFAEHAGRYGHIAAALNDAGFSVWALDHRGHGRSEGDRGDVVSIAAAVADLDLFVDTVRDASPALPLYLVGHSMGGLIATAYAEDHQERLDGLVLSGALLHVLPEIVALADLPEIPDLGLAALVSSDPAVVQAYKDDPLVYLGPPPRSMLLSLDQIEGVKSRFKELTLPILAMHGSSDLLVDPQALRDLVSGVSSDDLTAILWPGLWHEIFNEPRGHEVIATLVSWIGARVV